MDVENRYPITNQGEEFQDLDPKVDMCDKGACHSDPIPFLPSVGTTIGPIYDIN